MRANLGKALSLIAGLLVAALCAGSAQAQMEQDHDQGRGHGREEATAGFANHDRMAVHAYFRGAHGDKECPPGLAKKENGCLPPGQAKKWAVGQPLPAGEPVYPLPPELVVQLTPPPSGYRYVRMAGDILMVAAATNMVVDAIQDLGR